MFLVAAVITVVAIGVVLANVQVANGQGVGVSGQTLDQLTSIIIQLMVVFWIALIGYFAYRYFANGAGKRAKGKRGTEDGRSRFPYAIALLALWLILFAVNPTGGDHLFNGWQGVDRNLQTNSTQSVGEPSRDIPLVLPALVILIAIASVVLVWRFMRRGDGPTVTIAERTTEEDARTVLGDAVGRLHAGEDPRSTIIRAYQQMCLLVQVGKLGDEPFLTPREFARQAVDKLGWERAPLEDLTLLFEEARYSDHVLGEVQKERAVASFERVREGLGGAPIGRAAQ